MEQNSQCELIPNSETDWMNEYSFGQNPNSDTCSQIITTCMYDELNYATQSFTRWYELASDSGLFDITIEAYDFSESSKTNFLSTEILTFSPETDRESQRSVPKQVDMTISYFQKDRDTKKIIGVELVYDNYEELSDEEDLGLKDVYYNLTFSMISLSHTKLTIAFAFDWNFYLVLFLMVGFVSINVIIIFTIYHRIMARPSKPGKRIAKFKFFSYIKLTIPPALYGIGLAMMPVLIMNFFVCAFFTGYFMNFNTSIYPCELENTDSCPLTLFDNIHSGESNIDFDNLRKGRCGTALFILGIYLMILGLQILVPDKSDKFKSAESFDGNIWEFYTWKRSNMIFCTAFLIFFNLAVIQFSFSDLFSDNIWVMIVSYKVVSIIVERVIENAVQDKLLLASYSTSNNIVLGLVTFGSDDFLEFLVAYFIDVGI
mmetsp:Transcript_9638/g.9300  ORF Transcript_9638/g.9300 Transcript_9638/m.9300 type:complete len:430 (+) Transcript_9638:820-2109(+)